MLGGLWRKRLWRWAGVYLCICVFAFEVFVSNFPYGFLISTSVVRSVEVGGAGCAGRPREKEALAPLGAGRGWSLLSSSSWQLVGSQ